MSVDWEALRAAAREPGRNAYAVVAADGAPIAPCGRCRQLLHEAGGPELEIDGFGPLAQLLHSPFDATDVRTRTAPT